MKALTTCLICLSCCLWPQLSAESEPREEFVVWNVGQGSWATWITLETCLHFDMGGEFVDWASITRVCKAKQNIAYFSHWDWDHISFARAAKAKLPGLCIAAPPGGDPPTARKRAWLSRLPSCPNRSRWIRELRWRLRETATSNASSRVFTVGERALIPGDSSRAEEKTWRESIGPRVRWLILGHHGSGTSTSQDLLEAIPDLDLAVASARKKRYGHPHADVLSRLREKGAATLTTEEWGHIRLALSSRK